MRETIRFVGVVMVDGIRCKVCEQAGQTFGLYGEDGGGLIPMYMTSEQLKEAIPQLPIGSVMREAMETSLSMKGLVARCVPQVEEPDYW